MHDLYSRFGRHISSTARASVAGPFQRLWIPRAHGLLSKVGRFWSTNVDFSYGKGQLVFLLASPLAVKMMKCNELRHFVPVLLSNFARNQLLFFDCCHSEALLHQRGSGSRCSWRWCELPWQSICIEIQWPSAAGGGAEWSSYDTLETVATSEGTVQLSTPQSTPMVWGKMAKCPRSPRSQRLPQSSWWRLFSQEVPIDFCGKLVYPANSRKFPHECIAMFPNKRMIYSVSLYVCIWAISASFSHIIVWRLLACLSIIFLNEFFWMFTVNFCISLCLYNLYRHHLPPLFTHRMGRLSVVVTWFSRRVSEILVQELYGVLTWSDSESSGIWSGCHGTCVFLAFCFCSSRCCRQKSLSSRKMIPLMQTVQMEVRRSRHAPRRFFSFGGNIKLETSINRYDQSEVWDLSRLTHFLEREPVLTTPRPSEGEDLQSDDEDADWNQQIQQFNQLKDEGCWKLLAVILFEWRASPKWRFCVRLSTSRAEAHLRRCHAILSCVWRFQVSEPATAC